MIAKSFDYLEEDYFVKNEANPMPFLDKRHQPMGIFRWFLLQLLDDRLFPSKISEEFSGGFSCGFQTTAYFPQKYRKENLPAVEEDMSYTGNFSH